MVPTDLPTTPSACATPAGFDLGSRRRPGPADSPSDSDAGLAPDSRRSQLCDGVPGARPPGFARLLRSRGDPTTRPGRVSPDGVGPRLAPSSSEEPSSNIGTAPSSMEPRERWVGAGGNACSSHGAAHGVGAPTPRFVTASRTAGSNSLPVRRPSPGPVAPSAAAAASTAARVSPSLACVMMCLPTSASPHSSRISARSSSATKCVTGSPPPGAARGGRRSDGRVGSGGRARRLLPRRASSPARCGRRSTRVSPSRDAACTAIRARGSCRATGGRVARGCARTRRGRAGICASRN